MNQHDRLTNAQVAHAVLTVFNAQDEFVDEDGIRYWIANREPVEHFYGSNSGNPATWNQRFTRLNSQFATTANYSLIGAEEADRLYIADVDWPQVSRELHKIAQA